VKTRDLFFVDLEQFDRAIALGMNAAVSYLLLARGTGRDHSTTAWGINSIEQRTGIGRRRAKIAVGALCSQDLARPKRVGRYPGYALTLGETGALACLPNTIVDGASDEIPPVERLRRIGSVEALRMLVRAYGHHDLADNGGLDWRLVRTTFQMTEVTTRGRYRILGFSSGEKTGKWEDPLRAPFAQTPEGNSKYWEAHTVLIEEGLLEEVPHLVEGDTDESEIIMPLPLAGSRVGTEVERGIAAAIDEALEVLFSDDAARGFYFELQNFEHVAIVPDSFPQAALVGVFRLRYRPHNRVTAQWFAQQARAQEIADGYQELARRSSAREPLGLLPVDIRNVQHQEIKNSRDQEDLKKGSKNLTESRWDQKTKSQATAPRSPLAAGASR